MTPDAFHDYWHTTYPEAPPVAYLLRETYADRWFRIHTLLASKRYADNDEEIAEIVRRHHVLLADVLGTTPCVLVLTSYSETPHPVLSSAWLRDHYPDSQPFATITMTGATDREQYQHFFMVTRTYDPGAFDPLLRLVAEDVVDNVLFVRLDNAHIYAPYDGGADVILSSSAAREAMRQRYGSWLSTEPTGL